MPIGLNGRALIATAFRRKPACSSHGPKAAHRARGCTKSAASGTAAPRSPTGDCSSWARAITARCSWRSTPATGEEQWIARVGEIYEEFHGDGPRSTPTVDGQFVYALGAKGNLVCVEAEGGKDRVDQIDGEPRRQGAALGVRRVAAGLQQHNPLHARRKEGRDCRAGQAHRRPRVAGQRHHQRRPLRFDRPHAPRRPRRRRAVHVGSSGRLRSRHRQGALGHQLAGRGRGDSHARRSRQVRLRHQRLRRRLPAGRSRRRSRSAARSTKTR